MWRISFAHARPIPASARWSRSSECSRRESERRISPSRSAPTPSASGPRCASSASACSGRQQPDAGALLRAGLGQHELGAVRRSAAGTRATSAPSRPAAGSAGARGHQVDEQDELAVLGREEQALGAPLGARRAAGPRAPRAAGRTSSASRCARGRRARSGTRARARRARGARPPPRAVQARTLPRHGPAQGNRAAGERGRGRAPRARRRGRGRARRGVGRRSGAPHVLPLVVEADPGAPARVERDDVDERELAIACASHRAEPAQLEAVESLLAKAPATEDDLECGPQEGRGPSRLAHNCSGKHAGFLAVCRARGWPTEGYRLASHPLQQLLLAEVAGAAEVPAARSRPRSTAAACSRSR